MRYSSLGYRLFPDLRSGVIDRPKLEEPPIDDMPPLNVIKCQCTDSCPFSDPCDLDATQEDLLCDPCRKAKKHADVLKAGVFSEGMVSAVNFMRKARSSLSHCHQCDPEFNKEGDGNAPS